MKLSCVLLLAAFELAFCDPLKIFQDYDVKKPDCPCFRNPCNPNPCGSGSCKPDYCNGCSYKCSPNTEEDALNALKKRVKEKVIEKIKDALQHSDVPYPAKKCPHVLCEIYCPFGNVLVYGCPICKCKPKPVCPPICYKFCPYGFVTDINGCAICKCRCPPVCKIYCPFGNVLVDGCPICQCKPGPKSDGDSDNQDQLQIFQDYDAKKPGCQRVYCFRNPCYPNPCGGGYCEPDYCNGCNYKCFPATGNYEDSVKQALIPADPIPKKECPPVCMRYCEFGNVLVDGCPICKCIGEK